MRPTEHGVAEQHFKAFVGHDDFPCVGAKSALNRRRLRFGHFAVLGDSGVAELLCAALYEYLEAFPKPGVEPVSFVAVFDSAPAGEREFEAALWRQLQQLHEVDRRRFGWDASVSSDPAQHDFSFSIGGRGLFVVGLHPAASRLSRRAPAPTLVFNQHEQFEQLRAAGRYESMQRVVRSRDLALQGSLNPVLSRFGEASEALQYSGRAVEPNWRCPFQASPPMQSPT